MTESAEETLARVRASFDRQEMMRTLGVEVTSVELGKVEPGKVRYTLARSLGDPTLQLGLWLPERDVWVDEQGRELAIPDDHDRGVTHVGDQLAVMVHDRDLLDQPRLLEAVGSAGRLALENERLHAELRAQLAELQASRARIVRTADEERRRLERDLHDGAQQRLVALAVQLRTAQRRFGEGQAIYETAGDTEHHDHLICIECDHVIEFTNDDIDVKPQMSLTANARWNEEGSASTRGGTSVPRTVT